MEATRSVRSLPLAALIALIAAPTFAQSGGGYVIKKSTIDAGGYTYHTGGGYKLGGTVGLLHVTGTAIVPSSIYDVENLAGSCAGNEASCAAVSAPLQINTTRWGDVVAAFQDPNAPASQPDFADIGALVDKFKSALGAPIKARAALAGSVPDLGPDIGFAHISACSLLRSVGVVGAGASHTAPATAVSAPGEPLKQLCHSGQKQKHHSTWKLGQRIGPQGNTISRRT